MKDAIILIAENGMGRGDPSLQQSLFAKYTELLLHYEELPAAICFYTEGVRLVCEGSPVIENLRALQARGVHLIICSTCLNYYSLTEKVKVGIVGGMGDILEAQNHAEKVIRL